MKLGLACIGLLMPTVLFAQVVNGDFSSGSSGWLWKHGFSDMTDNCYPVAIGSGSVGRFAYMPGPDRYASLLPNSSPGGYGSRNVCGEIEQSVIVPHGTQLRFYAQLGKEEWNESPYITLADVLLSVTLVSDSGARTNYSSTGQSKLTSCKNFGGCPAVGKRVVNVSQFWGQRVKLVFWARSHEASSSWGQATVPSPAYVGNIAFEAAPPPPPPPPTVTPIPPVLTAPVMSGRNITVSWSAIYKDPTYTLEQSINGGLWTQAYKGTTPRWAATSLLPAAYRYRVKVCTGNGCSAFSPEVRVDIAASRNDVDGDGRSDVLWHNRGAQQMDWWLMAGAERQAVGSKAIGSQFHVAASGDFNGDGRGDLVWLDDQTTAVWLWQAEAGGGYSIHFIDNHPANGWEVVGAGDINNDGRADMVWHNVALQQAHWWLMDGANRLAVGSKPIDGQYRVAAVGDFNGDRRSDILWRGDSTLWLWQADGVSGFSIHLIGNLPVAGWEIVGAGDVNADGRADVLWHNVGLQQVDWWLMHGATRAGVGSRVIPAQYRVGAIGDYNGDGRSDLFWRNDARTELWIWQADASGGFSPYFVDDHPATGWEILGK